MTYYYETYPYQGYIKVLEKEIYAKRPNGDEFYDYDEYTKNDIPAKDEKGIEYYAQTHNNREIYPYNSTSMPFYIFNGFVEVYAKDLTTNRQYYPDPFLQYALIYSNYYYYAKDEHNNEYYAQRDGADVILKSDEKDQYAKTFDLKDIYPLKANRAEPIYAVLNGQPVYAKDENNVEFYFNANGVEQYLFTKDKGEIYAKNGMADVVALNNNNIPYYATNEKGDEYLPRNQRGYPFYIQYNNIIIYPKTRDGKVKYYETDSDGNQTYLLNEKNVPIYAKDEHENDLFATLADGSLYYAQNNNIEYYPKMKNGRQFYLKNLFNYEIYAKNNKNEYYAKDENNCDYCAQVDSKEYYAVDENGEEIYPQTDSKSNYYIFNEEKEQCALDKKGIPYYAKDERGQEFYPLKKNEDETILEVNTSAYAVV